MMEAVNHSIPIPRHWDVRHSVLPLAHHKSACAAYSLSIFGAQASWEGPWMNLEVDDLDLLNNVACLCSVYHKLEYGTTVSSYSMSLFSLQVVAVQSRSVPSRYPFPRYLISVSLHCQ